MSALVSEIRKGGRTWTSPQAAAWLAEHQGVRISPSWVCELLKRAGMTYKRTQRRLKHKQRPEEVARKRAELEEAEKRAMPGR
jgi:transposase